MKTEIGSPQIQRATVVTDAGGTKVTLPKGSPEDTKAWTMYAMCRVSADRNRAAGVPRTAAEELKCLDMAADSAAKAAPGTLGPGLQALVALKRVGMVECWLLLNGPDQDVLREYPAYREGHRELLIGYLDNFVIHDGVAAAGRSTLQTQP